MPVIVIVGGGFAGIAVARRLERRLRPGEAEIVLLSRDNYSLFTPMLPEVTSGELEVRHVVTPIREQLARTRFVLADVDAIDVERREVTYHHVLTGTRIVQRYDHLVLALGSSTSTFGLPGVAEHTWPLKRLEDADALRNHLVWLLELADTVADSARRRRLLTLVVVGGGFTGVETAGEIVELFRSVLRFYKNLRVDEVRMLLVEAGPSLLAGLPPKMGEYSRRVLERRGVEVLLGDGVASADESGLTLTERAPHRIGDDRLERRRETVADDRVDRAADDEARRSEHGARHAGPRFRRRVGARRLRRDSGRRRWGLSHDRAARDSRGAAARRQHRRGASCRAHEAVSVIARWA